MNLSVENDLLGMDHQMVCGVGPDGMFSLLRRACAWRQRGCPAHAFAQGAQTHPASPVNTKWPNGARFTVFQKMRDEPDPRDWIGSRNVRRQDVVQFLRVDR